MTIGDIIHQKIYEKVEFLLRRDFFTFIPVLILFVILFLAPAGVGLLLQNYLAAFLAHPIFYPLIVMFLSIYYLSIILFFFSYFITFYLDIWVITNDRLVDIRQVSLFSRVIAEVDLYQIQDITSEVQGFFPSLLNYGNIYIQTAGPVSRFILYDVPHPHKLRAAILNLAAQDRKYHQHN